MIGKLVFSSDLNTIPQLMFGPYQIVFFSENEMMESRIPPDLTICGGILLPPYSLMTKLIEPEDAFPIMLIADEYFAYLHSYEPMLFMTGLLALLLRGISVAIFIGSCEAEFSIIPATIKRFLNLRYGMMPEHGGQGFLFPVDPMYTDQIYSDLFLYDYCDLAFLQKCHSNHPFNNEVNNKILRMDCINQQIQQPNTNQGPIDPFRVIQ